jgi:hypothetical protein
MSLLKACEKPFSHFAHKKKYSIDRILSGLRPYCKTGLTFSNAYLN